MQRLLILVVLLPINLFAQSNYAPFAGAQSAGLGHSTVAFAQAFSTHHNQAALTFLEEEIFTAVSFQQRYFLNNLNLGHFGFSSPLANGRVGLAISYFGFDEYNESKIGLAYARKFGKYLAFSLQFNYEQNYVNEAQNLQTLTFEAGVLAQLNEKLRVGFHLYNPNGAYLSEDLNLRLPSLARLGMAYNFSANTVFLIEAQNEFNTTTRYSTGLQYQLVKALAFRAGMAIADDYEASAGLGFFFKDFSAHLAYQQGFILGGNLSVELQCLF